jgi:four helix bundle protein
MLFLFQGCTGLNINDQLTINNLKAMKKDNPLKDKSYAFAVRIVKMYKYLCDKKHEYVLSKQVLRSGTSIGANIVEANGAISKDDFSAKMSIAYKEALETKYWLDLLKDSGYLESKGYDELYQEADEISRMLFAVLKSTGRVRSISKDQ